LERRYTFASQNRTKISIPKNLFIVAGKKEEEKGDDIPNVPPPISTTMAREQTLIF
tara:strand:- start:41 stop:208 length:168 start_codon:yes stop_codon:yes gene_type:complete